MNRDTFEVHHARLTLQLREVMRALKWNEEEYLASIDAHPIGCVVETIEGASSKKPRRLTMRVAGRSVQDGVAWYYLSSDITGDHTARAVTRFVPHTAIVSVLLPKVEPLPR